MGRSPPPIGALCLGATLVGALALAGGQAPPAAALTTNLTRACRPLVAALERPPGIGGATPPAILARFGALRAPQGASDTPPTGLRRAITGVFTSYEPSSVRRLGAVPGGAIYIVSGTASRPQVSAACRRALSARELRGVEALGGDLPSGPGYCLLEYAPAALGRESCNSYSAVATGYALGADSQGPASDYLGLVPDGIGGVRLTYASRRAPVTLSVVDNLASGRAPAGFTSIPQADRTSPGRLRRHLERTLPTSSTWLGSPTGPVVRTFARPGGLVEQGVLKVEALESIV